MLLWRGGGAERNVGSRTEMGNATAWFFVDGRICRLVRANDCAFCRFGERKAVRRSDAVRLQPVEVVRTSWIGSLVWLW